MSDNSAEKFIELIANIVEREFRDIKITDKFKQYEQMDSVTLLSILIKIDEQYGVNISIEQFDKFVTIGDIYNYIEAKKKY